MNRFCTLRQIIRLAAIASLLALLINCGGKPDVAEDTPIILITLDTLRSDHLSVYGYDKIQTPEIDALAADSVLFERAYSHAAVTLNSHATLMTGLMPGSHGVRDNTGYVLGGEYETIAERLKTKGYRTGAVVSSMVLRQVTGMAQGFDFYDDQLSGISESRVRNFAQRRGDKSTAIARKWLDDNKNHNSLFLWLHLYDPHTPYKPPAPFAASYDGEVAYTDTLVGDLMNHLKSIGLYDKSMIILTSDHGEGLGEHGEDEHGMLVYRESIQVPLLIKYPKNQLAGKTVSKPVGLVDLAPTIEDAVNLDPIPSDGVPLNDMSAIPGSRTLYAEALYAEIHYGWYAHRSTIRKELHYLEGKEIELFDMVEDPAELNNLYGQKKIHEEMITLLEANVNEGKNTVAGITDEEKAMLESLGYTGSFDFGDDVKQLSFTQLNELKQKLQGAQRALNEERFEEVDELTMSLLRSYPTLNEAKNLLAMSLTSQKKWDQAENVIMEALVGSPRDASLMVSLAGIKIVREQWEDAIQLASRAIPIDPNMVSNRLLPQFYDQGKLREAEGIANQALATGATSGYAHYVLGRTAMLKNDISTATDHLQKATSRFREGEFENKPFISGLVFLAQCLTIQGKSEESLTALRKALDLNPRINQTRFLLADSLLRNNRASEADSLIAEGLQASPDDIELLQAHARAKLKLGQGAEAMEIAERALKINPKIAVGALAFAFVTSAPAMEAETFAKLALNHLADQPYSYYILGRLSHQKKDYKGAIAQLQKAVPLYQEFPDRNLVAETFYYLGDSEASLGDPNKALPYFQEALKVNPTQPRYHLTLVTFFGRLGEKQRAVQTAEAWVKQFPRRNHFQAIAQLFTQLGYTEEANRYTQLAQTAPQ